MIAVSRAGWALAAFLAAVVVLQLVTSLFDRKRRAGWQPLAESRGWTYLRKDPTLIDIGFSMCGWPGIKKFVNVISGQHAGLVMKRFTLIRASGRYSSSTSVVAAELTAPMPEVIVTGRFGSLQGRHDELQRFEGGDEPFKRAFNIWTTDSAFATVVFDPLMTEWMLSLGRTYGFEVNGARGFACGGSRRPRDVDGLIDACSGFVQ